MNILRDFYQENTVAGSKICSEAEMHFLSIAPRGSLALCIVDGEGKNYETARGVISRFYKAEPINAVSFSAEKAEKLKIKSEIGLIISIGGERAVALGKFLSYKYGLKHIFFALNPCSVEYLIEFVSLPCRDGYNEIYPGKVPSLIFCDDDLLLDGDDTANGYGRICSRLVGLFDADVRRVVYGECNESAYCKCLRTICDTIKEREITAQKIFRYGIILSEGLKELGWSADACISLVRALKLKKKAEKSEVVDDGKVEGEVAKIIASIYLSALSRPLVSGVFAPNNNRSMGALSQVLGIHPFRARRVVSRLQSNLALEEHLYCLSLYRDELKQRASLYRKTLIFTAQKQKRLYKDKGFSYNGYADENSVRVALPFVAEMRGKFTLFSLLKQTGYISTK